MQQLKAAGYRDLWDCASGRPGPFWRSVILLLAWWPSLWLSPVLLAQTLNHQLEIDFSDRSLMDDSVGGPEIPAVWNQALGQLHPPIEAIEVVDHLGAPLVDRSLDLGDGRHGAFVSSRYAEFSEGGDTSGSIIRLNTDDFPELAVTEFVLEAGWRLEPIGSEPLVIRSLSRILIEGVIDCSGLPGAEQNPDSSLQALGGAGRCGGGSGGAGSTVDGGNNQQLPAEAGLSGGPGVTGGAAAPATGGGASGGIGGGGGGGFSQDSAGLQEARRGTHPDIPGGGPSGGDNFRDDGFLRVGGGSGGGGGSGFGGSSGAGGGGGGGFVKLVAQGDIEVGPTGRVLANGGAGGGVMGVGLGGGGGGGAGGSIALLAGGRVRLVGPGTQVEALEGFGGLSSGGNGGEGARGRTWLTDSAGVPDGAGLESPDCLLSNCGKVAFVTGNPPETLVAQTQWMDLGVDISAVDSVELFDSQDPAALVPSSDYTLTPEVSGQQLRLRLEWTNSSADNPVRFSLLRVNYQSLAPPVVDPPGGGGGEGGGSEDDDSSDLATLSRAEFTSGCNRQGGKALQGSQVSAKASDQFSSLSCCPELSLAYMGHSVVINIIYLLGLFFGPLWLRFWIRKK